MPITLSDINGLYKPDDLVPVIIEQIKSKNEQLVKIKNKKSEKSKYLIHVENDVFGLFSEKYVYYSSKYITKQINQLFGMILDYFSYENGFMSLYFQDKDTKAFNLDDRLKRMLKVLSVGQEVELLDSKCYRGTYVINSYNGASRLKIGNYLKIKLPNKEIFTKISLSNDKIIHIHGLKKSMEEQLNKVKKLDEKIRQFTDLETKTILEKIISQKTIEKMLTTFTLCGLEKYTFIEILVYLELIETPESKILSLLKEVNKDKSQ